MSNSEQTILLMKVDKEEKLLKAIGKAEKEYKKIEIKYLQNSTDSKLQEEYNAATKALEIAKKEFNESEGLT